MIPVTNLQRILPLILSFIISLGLIGFAASIYSNDRGTSLAIIAVVGGHWLGVGSVVTGKTLSEMAASSSVDNLRQTADIIKNSESERHHD